MTLPTAQQTADFVNNWNAFQTYISYWCDWCKNSKAVSDALIADPNFTVILSAAEQTWVQSCQSFFSTIEAQLPVCPPK